MQALFSTSHHAVAPEYGLDSFTERQSLAFGSLIHQHYNALQDDQPLFDLGPLFGGGEALPAPAQLCSSAEREDDAGYRGMSRYRHRRESWDLRRDEIRQLYIENRQTLATVMRVLASKGFMATKKQYKRQLQAWGFSKNVRRQDAVQMLSLRQQRAQEGKTTEFEISGRPVDLDEYLKRTRAFVQVITQPEPSEVKEMPQYIRPRTPRLSIRIPIGSSDILRVQELIHVYCTSLPSSQSSLLPRPGQPHVSQIGETMQVFELLFKASWLFDEKYFEAAGRLTRDAFLRIETLHRASFPQFLLFTLYGSIIYPVKTDILLRLWKYLAARCSFVEKSTAGTRLATSVYKLLRANNSSPEVYFKLIPDLIERVLDINVNQQVKSNNGTMSMDPGFLQWLIKPKMNMDLERTPETSFLIQQCIERSILYIQEPILRQVFEACASALGMEQYDQWQPPPYRERNIDGGDVPMLGIGEWMYYAAVARVEKRRCRDQILVGNPRHDLACYYLERSIKLWLNESAAQPHVIRDLRTLEKWCREGGDFLQADAARRRCDKEMARLIGAPPT
ncbi:hypothetical protein G7054_g1886 [Neopestalotiopsis clavispora]|nr:hypothetical protein G7054_g1886 [Neopestalotiopsis clavispora]